MPAALIALRYLRGRRGANAAPLLSRISMLALAVGSAAMITLFSVFNGFERVIADLYTAFYSDMRISPAKGKFFTLPPDKLQSLKSSPGIAHITPVIEDNAFVRTEDEQIVVTLRGIADDYMAVNNLKPYIVAGGDRVSGGDFPTAIAGMHIAARLGLSVDNDFSRLTVHYPNADAGNIALNPLNAVSTLELRPHGIFKVQEEFDQRYVLATLPIVQKLFGAEGEWSSLEIRLAPGADKKAVQTRLRQLLGNGFIVETRYEQNRMLNSVMRTEKWATYVILLFVLLIASVNMIGAMSLLVLEKGRDMALLTAMGARSGAIRAIFLLEGMLWAAVGGGIGLIAGALLCLGQQRWGWIRLQGGFIIEAYPVAMRPLDFLVIIATVLAVGLIAAAYPAIRAGKIRQLAN
jgi:lipoprotein-releasing system permease protein